VGRKRSLDASAQTPRVDRSIKKARSGASAAKLRPEAQDGGNGVVAADSEADDIALESLPKSHPRKKPKAKTPVARSERKKATKRPREEVSVETGSASVASKAKNAKVLGEHEAKSRRRSRLGSDESVASTSTVMSTRSRTTRNSLKAAKSAVIAEAASIAASLHLNGADPESELIEDKGKEIDSQRIDHQEESLPLPPPVPSTRISRRRVALPPQETGSYTTQSQVTESRQLEAPNPENINQHHQQQQQQQQKQQPEGIFQAQTAPPASRRRHDYMTSTPIPGPRFLEPVSEEESDEGEEDSVKRSDLIEGGVCKEATPFFYPPSAAEMTSRRGIAWLLLTVFLPMVVLLAAQYNWIFLSNPQGAEKHVVSILQKKSLPKISCINVPGHGSQCGPGFVEVEKQLRDAVRTKVEMHRTEQQQRVQKLESQFLQAQNSATLLHQVHGIPKETTLSELSEGFSDVSLPASAKIVQTKAIQFLSAKTFAKDAVDSVNQKLREHTRERAKTLRERKTQYEQLRGSILRRLMHIEAQTTSVSHEVSSLRLVSITIDHPSGSDNVVVSDEVENDILYDLVVTEELENLERDFMTHADLLAPSESVLILNNKGQTSVTRAPPCSLPANISSSLNAYSLGRVYDNICSKLLGLPGPETVLKNTFPIRNCWSFDGSSGNFSVVLSRPSMIRGLAIEHHQVHLAPLHSPQTAPKLVTLVGLNLTSQTEFELMDTEYDITGPAVQQATLPTGMFGPFEAVKIRIDSNHGADYTCLHRVRVF